MCLISKQFNLTLYSEPVELNTRPRKKRDTEEEHDNLAVLPRISNPVACLSSGDMLIFHLTINHTGTHTLI